MKKLLLLLLLVTSSVLTFSQVPNFLPDRSSPSVTAQDARLRARLNFYFPHVHGLTLNGGLDTVGMVLFEDSSRHIWYRDGIGWAMFLRNGDIAGGVTSFNTRTGAVTLISGDITTALGFTPISNITSFITGGTNVTLSGLGTLVSPYVINASSGPGTVTTFNFTNGNGLIGLVSNPTSTPTLSLGTSLNGIIKGTGTGFGTVVVGSGLIWDGTTLSVSSGGGSVTTVGFTNANGITGTISNPTTTPNITLGTTLNGIVSANGTGFSTITIGAGLSFGTGTLTNTINNTNQLTNGAGFLTNITGLVTGGSNVTVTGSGTSGSPYSISVAGAGTGTVTNFSAGNLSPLFTTTVTNPTTIPGLSFTITNASALTVLGNGTGSSAAPTYFTPNSTIINSWFGASLQTVITLTTTGTTGAATFSGGTLNIPNYTSGGTIGGSIAVNQVAVGSGSNTINGFSTFTFSSGNLTTPNLSLTSLASAGVNDSVLTIDPATKIVHWRSGVVNLFAVNGLSVLGGSADSIGLGGSLYQNTTIGTAGVNFLITGLPNKTYVSTDSNLIEDNTGKFLKVALLSLTTTGTSGAATFSPATGVLNIPSYSGGGSSNPFADNTALVKNNADNTKLLILSAASISTATTRTATFPDANITVADKLTGLSQFPGNSTSSAQLAAVMNDEQGIGSLVFNNSPTLLQPILNTTSVTGQVWTSTNNFGAGIWANAIGGVNTVKRTFTLTSHGFLVDEPLYINSSGIPTPADTINFATMVVDSVINTNTFEVTMAGTYNHTAHGKTVGSYYYVTMPAGSLTTTSPNKSQYIIFVQDANTIQVINTRPVDFTGSAIGTLAIDTLIGDGTAIGPGKATFTLATVNSNVGTFGDATHVPQFTVNGKGLITGVTSVAISGGGSAVTLFTTTSDSLNVLTSLPNKVIRWGNRGFYNDSITAFNMRSIAGTFFNVDITGSNPVITGTSQISFTPPLVTAGTVTSNSTGVSAFGRMNLGTATGSNVLEIKDPTSSIFTEVRLQGTTAGGTAGYTVLVLSTSGTTEAGQLLGVGSTNGGLGGAGTAFEPNSTSLSGVSGNLNMCVDNGTGVLKWFIGGTASANEIGRIATTGNWLHKTTTDVPTSMETWASTTQGIRPPSMTTTQQNAISSPATGLFIYDNILNNLAYFNGTSWIDITTPSTPTLQQVLTAGSTFTGANTVAQANNALTFSAGQVVLTGNANWNPGAAIPGSIFSFGVRTLTDNVTASSGTVTNATVIGIATPTLAATNTSVTTTNAYTLYINAAPTAGTNETITNSYALGVGGTGLFQSDLISNHQYDNSITPSIAAGTGAGTTPTISISGSDQSGIITLTTGTAPTLSAVIATITYGGGYTFRNATYPIVHPGNSAAALLTGVTNIFTTGSTTNFTITSGTTGLASATQYIWYYRVGGK